MICLPLFGLVSCSVSRCCVYNVHTMKQVPDDREGGNQQFDDGISYQYEDEVSHMMRRIKLNFYRAEDEMFILAKRRWRVSKFQTPSLGEKIDTHNVLFLKLFLCSVRG